MNSTEKKITPRSVQSELTCQDDEIIMSARRRANSAFAMGASADGFIGGGGGLGHHHHNHNHHQAHQMATSNLDLGSTNRHNNNGGSTAAANGAWTGGWMVKRLKRRLSQALRASAGHLFGSLILPTNGHHNHTATSLDVPPNHAHHHYQDDSDAADSAVGYEEDEDGGGGAAAAGRLHPCNKVKGGIVVNNGRRSKSSITLQSPPSVASVAEEESVSELAERLEDHCMSVSMYGDVNGYIDDAPSHAVVTRNKQRQSYKMATNGYQLRANGGNGITVVKINNNTGRSSASNKGAVVQEHPSIGSDGESEEASPSCSDDVASPQSVNVRMRQKPSGGRRWSEQDIQKRLSLPADLRLPLSVVEKLNATPTLDQPLTRKNRRVSLSEIGFGKLESYQKLEKLGEGTYATVYKGRSRLTDALVALKEIRLEQEEGAPCTAIREASLLRNLRHANVVTLHDIIHTDRTLTLVFEYLDRDLKQYMDDCGNILSMNNVRLFLFQLLRGLAYCHSGRVLHRDLKPQNLLINDMGELKLADFGLARAKSVPTKTYSHEVVTLWYRPPDILLGSTHYSTYIDMWGVGCILYEMAAGRPFFPGSTVEEQLHLIFRALGTPQPHLHPQVATSSEFMAFRFPNYRPEPLVNHAPRLDVDGLDLLSQFLQYEGKRRISAKNALHHPFFSCLPPEIHELQDTDSIFNIPGVHLSRDPGHRGGHQYHNHHYHHRHHHHEVSHHQYHHHNHQNGQANNKTRRQSMLL